MARNGKRDDNQSGERLQAYHPERHGDILVRYTRVCVPLSASTPTHAFHVAVGYDTEYRVSQGIGLVAMFDNDHRE